MSNKICNVFSVVAILTVFLFPLVFSQSKVTAYANQGEACEEYQRCLGIREKIKTTIKTLDLGPDVLKVELDKSVCAYQSNCRKERRAICKTHMQENGCVELKAICLVSWLKGSDETDATDPATASNIESNQTVACSNYENCVATADNDHGLLQKLPGIGDYAASVKEMLCAEKTNCKRVQKDLCEKLPAHESNHKLGKLASVSCAITWFADQEQNSIGSRSSFGVVSKGAQVLAQVCPGAKGSVCVIS